MIIRDACPNDNVRLIQLEGVAPQGSQIKLTSERSDYFVRANRFDHPVLKVAEDETTGDILGIMGVGAVRVSIGGQAATGGLIFDWRSNPLIQKGLNRHMLRLWQAVEKEIETRDLDFLFGYIKEDNLRSLNIILRSGAKIIERCEFLTIPVHRIFCRHGDRYPVAVAPKIDAAAETDAIRQAFAGRDLLPWPVHATGQQALTDAYVRAKISLGRSSLKIWDSSADYTQRVMHLPRLYRAARPVFAAISHLVPLPHIPRIGEAIRDWYLFDLDIADPADLPVLLEKARKLAVDSHIDYLIVCLNPKDVLYPVLARLSWIKLKYCLMYQPRKPIAEPREPTYFDIRFI